jgi:hypothetical protein
MLIAAPFALLTPSTDARAIDTLRGPLASIGRASVDALRSATSASRRQVPVIVKVLEVDGPYSVVPGNVMR